MTNSPKITYFVQQLEGLYTGNNWVAVGAESILDTIDAGTASQKKLPNRHTILEILQHTNAWRTFLLKRLQGDREFDLSQDDGVEWPENLQTGPEVWEKARRTYKELHLAILDNLKKCDDRLLSQRVAKRQYDFGVLINGIIQHDFYHFGQISLLR